MENENHIDRVLAFMESLEKLEAQLRQADDWQKQMLQRMLSLSQSNQTDTEEYQELQHRSMDLQAKIDKWRPIYEERMVMVKEIKQSAQRNKRK